MVPSSLTDLTPGSFFSGDLVRVNGHRDGVDQQVQLAYGLGLDALVLGIAEERRLPLGYLLALRLHFRGGGITRGALGRFERGGAFQLDNDLLLALGLGLRSGGGGRD